MEGGETTPHLATLGAKIGVTPSRRQRGRPKEEAMSTSREQWAKVAGTGARTHSHPPLQHPHRTGVLAVDQAIHPVSWQAPSDRDGRAGAHGVPERSGDRAQRVRLHSESGVECHPVPVSGRPEDPVAVAGRVTARQEAAASACGVHAPEDALRRAIKLMNCNY